MPIETGSSNNSSAESLNPQRQEQVRTTIQDLIINGNLEYSLGNPQHIGEAADLLPRSIGIYVPSLPGRSYTELLQQLTVLKQAGFDPIPHIAAKRVPSRHELHEFLSQANTELGVHRVMLIGGDSAKSEGPYNDAIELLEDGILADNGINETGLAGYPEGHPRINEETLFEALTRKLTLARQQGIAAEIVTQFCFNPGRIIDYFMRITSLAPGTPIFIGMAGPTNTRTLLRYVLQTCREQNR